MSHKNPEFDFEPGDVLVLKCHALFDTFITFTVFERYGELWVLQKPYDIESKLANYAHLLQHRYPFLAQVRRAIREATE